MSHDRALNLILITIGLLVLLAVGLFFFRQSRLDYGPEDNPEGVIRNYALAVQRADAQKAYAYLADAPGKPDFSQFRQMISIATEQIAQTGIEANYAILNGEEAVVGLVIVHNPRGPFGEIEREQQTAQLQRSGSTWKITQLPSPYWGEGWYGSSLPQKPESSG